MVFYKSSKIKPNVFRDKIIAELSTFCKFTTDYLFDNLTMYN